MQTTELGKSQTTSGPPLESNQPKSSVALSVKPDIISTFFGEIDTTYIELHKIFFPEVIQFYLPESETFFPVVIEPKEP